MDLINSLNIAASGMQAQSTRLKVIAQNIANEDDVGSTPGEQPYRRRIISFKNELDKHMGVQLVKVDKISEDESPYNMKYDPHHPAANADGYVALPNVNPQVEMADLREAQRSYEANVNVVDVTKTMLRDTLRVIE